MRCDASRFHMIARPHTILTSTPFCTRARTSPLGSSDAIVITLDSRTPVRSVSRSSSFPAQACGFATRDLAVLLPTPTSSRSTIAASGMSAFPFPPWGITATGSPFPMISLATRPRLSRRTSRPRIGHSASSAPQPARRSTCASGPSSVVRPLDSSPRSRRRRKCSRSLRVCSPRRAPRLARECRSITGAPACAEGISPRPRVPSSRAPRWRTGPYPSLRERFRPRPFICVASSGSKPGRRCIRTACACASSTRWSNSTDARRRSVRISPQSRTRQGLPAMPTSSLFAVESWGSRRRYCGRDCDRAVRPSGVKGAASVVLPCAGLDCMQNCPHSAGQLT